MSFRRLGLTHGACIPSLCLPVYIQYIEWIITTPLIVMNTGKTLAASPSMITALMLYDALMVITGFCASVVGNLAWRYIFFTISSLYFLAIFRILFFQKEFISKVCGFFLIVWCSIL